MIAQDDMVMLLDMVGTDPDFVEQYLGDNDPLVTVAQCAKALNVCNNTVLYRIKMGGLKAERNSDGHWEVKLKELKNHIKNGGLSKGFQNSERTRPQPQPRGELAMAKIGSYRYDKSSSQNVLDFLHHWEKANTVGFSTRTLTNDFNKVCATKTTEGQMSGILSTLTKKGILVRRGRGIYCLKEGFVKPVHAIPVAQIEEEDSDSHDYDYLKSEERQLVDKYLEQADPTEDFIFSISDIAAEFPDADRRKIGKAVGNMCYNEKLAKGKNLGEYVKKATKKKEPKPVTVQSPVQQVHSSLGRNLEDVLKLNISDDLKAKVIKEMMA